MTSYEVTLLKWKQLFDVYDIFLITVMALVVQEWVPEPGNK